MIRVATKVMGLTRLVLAGILGASLAGLTLEAQTSPVALSPRNLPGGLSISLPVDWRPPDSAGQARIRHFVDSLGKAGGAIGQVLSNGQTIPLLVEATPADPGFNINVNAAAAPGATAGVFQGLSDEAVKGAFAPLCDMLTKGASQLGSRAITCGPTALASVGDRNIALTTMVRTGPRGFVTVRMAQFPDRDVVYTITLTAPGSNDQGQDSLFSRIYQTFSIPK